MAKHHNELVCAYVTLGIIKIGHLEGLSYVDLYKKATKRQPAYLRVKQLQCSTSSGRTPAKILE